MISRQIYDNSLEYANDFQVKSQEKKKNYLFGVSERITYREMEFAVTLEAGVQQGPVLLAACRIVCFHAHIDTHQEILEIQADAGTVGRSNLLVELVELEHAARLVFIVLDGPDVARIHKKAQFNNPEKFGPVLQIDVEADVAALVDEFAQIVVAVIAARTQGAHTPAAHTVGTAAVEAFLKG